MLNTFFNPDPIAGRYNTSYEYDKAGNITGLNRYGLIDASAGQYTYGLIDSLDYTYANDDSRLSSIEDFVADPLAELKGFKIAGAFGYDGNGNFTSDGDQGLAIASNLINLPRIVASPIDSLLFEYTFGGEKIRKLQTSPVARDRIYLGGAEFVNDTLELYHHAEGRVVLSGVKPAFQYRIADHLGNTVVFFEDRDGDAKIKTESMTSDPDSLEVLQRNYYYPFGMEMEGPWQAATAPRADYLYNGKELEEDLKLNWYAYGFRYYDPSIGRFTGVDPIGAEFASISPYAYVANNPLLNIDPNGDSIIVTTALKQNDALWEGYQEWYNSKEGQEFVSLYGKGGKYESTPVYFDVLTESEKDDAADNGLMTAYAVNPILGKETRLVSEQDAKEGERSHLKKGEYAKYVVEVSPYGPESPCDPIHRANTGLRILHEAQHVEITDKEIRSYGKILSGAYWQHHYMKQTDGRYFISRFNFYSKRRPDLSKSDIQSSVNGFAPFTIKWTKKY